MANINSSSHSVEHPNDHGVYKQLFKDIMILMKPNITLLVIITTAGGIWLAPGEIPLITLFASILGTLGVVVGANTMNCYLERESDKNMARTKRRPLPEGRINARFALFFGLLITIVSTVVLWYWVNLTTTLLSSIAFISYVWIYTPMKRLSPQALTVGSIPGAMPPLMGWTSVTGSMDAPGLALFLILFFWQIPHFIAIAFYRQKEYEKAGLKTIPGIYGHHNAMWQNLFWSILLIASSLSLLPLGVAGWIYTSIALILGVILILYCIQGFTHPQRNLWARRLFLYTLIYLTLLFAALVIDAGPMGPQKSLPLPLFQSYTDLLGTSL
jgi:heme o synthase